MDRDAEIPTDCDSAWIVLFGLLGAALLLLSILHKNRATIAFFALWSCFLVWMVHRRLQRERYRRSSTCLKGICSVCCYGDDRSLAGGGTERGTETGTLDVRTGDICQSSWRRRGWLVILRTRCQDQGETPLCPHAPTAGEGSRLPPQSPRLLPKLSSLGFGARRDRVIHQGNRRLDDIPPDDATPLPSPPTQSQALLARVLWMKEDDVFRRIVKFV